MAIAFVVLDHSDRALADLWGKWGCALRHGLHLTRSGASGKPGAVHFKSYDAGKKITGRKRHILTDTDGRLLTVCVHGTDVQDRDGGKLPLKASRRRYFFVTRVLADGGYAVRIVD